MGVACAFNTGFEAASGEFHTRLAQDDLFRKNAIALLREHLKANPHVGLAYCDMQIINDDGKIVQFREVLEPDKVLTWVNNLGLCAMWRQTVGNFDSTYDYAEDYDF